MDPLPDYGLNSYKGSGKLQGKIAVITGKNKNYCFFKEIILISRW